MVFLAKIEVEVKVMKPHSHLMFSRPIITYVSGGKVAYPLPTLRNNLS